MCDFIYNETERKHKLKKHVPEPETELERVIEEPPMLAKA
jgi:hypothetical protein